MTYACQEQMLQLVRQEGFDAVASGGRTLLDPAARWTVDPAAMATAGRNSPFRDMELPGQVVATFLRGRATVLGSRLVEA